MPVSGNNSAYMVLSTEVTVVEVKLFVSLRSADSMSPAISLLIVTPYSLKLV